MTIISHFFNEEYLLPWWLNHHKEIFTHGIMIDYGSTDRSVEIIREICPTWEIRQTCNANFAAMDVDREVIEIERTVAGYKIALNTTEFIELPADFSPSTELTAYTLPRLIMVDDSLESDPVYAIPLVKQKRTAGGQNLSRFLHNYPDGNYGLGRHGTGLHTAQPVDGLHVLWYAFAPFTEEFIQRKLQIKDKIPQSDRACGFGFQHMWEREKIEEEREYYLKNCYRVL